MESYVSIFLKKKKPNLNLSKKLKSLKREAEAALPAASIIYY
jgi:hypothetical protein